MQKAKFPAIAATFVLCFAFWILLDFSFKIEELIAGAVVSLLVALFSARFLVHEKAGWFFNPVHLFSAVFFWCGTFLVELVKANVDMAKRCYGGCTKVNPGIDYYIHWIDVAETDRDKAGEVIKGRMENWIRRIWE